MRGLGTLAVLTGWIAVLALAIFLYLDPRFAPPGRLHLDKDLHIALFAATTALPLLCAVGRKVLIVPVGIVMAALAIGLEEAQASVPGRQYSLADTFANIAGVALAVSVAWLLSRCRGMNFRQSRKPT